MFYYKCNKSGWNNTGTSGFHAEWQRDQSAFCLLGDHGFWGVSGNTDPNHGNYGGSSGGVGTQVRGVSYQHTSSITELAQRHQGNSDYSNFISLLSNFYELMDHLKLLGVAYLTGLYMTIHSFNQ